MKLTKYESLELKMNMNLDEHQYTLSLLKECIRIGRMNTESVKKIQMETIYILKELIAKFTKGESSSIKTEIAEGILNSIYYTIDFALLNCKTPEEAVSLIETFTIKNVYLKGVELIKSSIIKTKILYEEVKLKKLNVPFEIYNETIDKGIPNFFKNYEGLFSAHETVSSMDYPLIIDNMDLCGIHYMKQYLDHLAAENLFCSYFKEDDIISLMDSYGRLYNMNIRNAPINIFEVIINNSIFTTLIGKNSNDLKLSKSEYVILQNKLLNLQESELIEQIQFGIETMIVELSINQESLLTYINNYKQQFLYRISNAFKAQDFKYLIIVNGIDINIKIDHSTFEKGIKMDDEIFRHVINNILSCNSTPDKIEIITTQLNSLEDFVDTLEADCLFDFEYKAVFTVLSDVELSVLGKIVFSENLRNGLICLNTTLGLEDAMDKEEIWQEQYVHFIKSIKPERIEAIEKCINMLE